MKGIAQSHFVGIQRVQPHKERIVHAFDLDDTITQKPDFAHLFSADAITINIKAFYNLKVDISLWKS